MVSVAGFVVDSAAAGGSRILEHIERFLVFRVFRIGFRRWFFNGFRNGRKTFVYGFRRWLFNGFRRGTERFYGFRRWFLMVSGCYRTAAFSPMETVKIPTTKEIRTFP